jgi:hypothetical protein
MQIQTDRLRQRRPFERYIAANHPLIFNADNESNTVKSRSRAKGPEPEGVALGNINGQTYAFITLERTGGDGL